MRLSSTTETNIVEPRRQEEREEPDCLVMKIATAQEANAEQLGIGVEISRANHARFKWALVDRKLNSVIQNEAHALKIALSKALEYQ